MKRLKIILFILIISFLWNTSVFSMVEITASSIENDSTLPEYAFDSNMQTRWSSQFSDYQWLMIWSSQFSDYQWLMIDLGEIREMVGLVLYWEAAYAKSYNILLSADRKEWQKVYSTTQSDGGIDDIYFGKRKARFIKIIAKERATSWGYSLWEVAIKGLDEEVLIEASSLSGSNTPENVFDGNSDTVWYSGKVKRAWLEIDMQKERDLGGLYIKWADDYALSYRIDVSNDKKIWQTVYEELNGKGDFDKLHFNILKKRYIRIMCKKSNKGEGYKIAEIELKNWRDLIRQSSLDKVRGLVGWEGYKWSTFIGKDGSFTPEPHPFLISFWLYDRLTNKLYTPQTLSTRWELEEGSLPIYKVSWEVDNLKVTTTIFSRWFKNLEGLLNFAFVSLKNKSSSQKNLSLYVVIQPTPLSKDKKGIREIEYDGGNIVMINGKVGLFLQERADEPFLDIGKDINIQKFTNIKLLRWRKKIEDIKGKASGMIVYHENLGPFEEKSFDFIVPSVEKNQVFSQDFLENLKFEENFSFVRNYWKNRIPIQIDLPDKKFVDCFYASLYYILIMMEGNKIYPGPYNYKSFFLHDAVDIANALDKAGLHSKVQQALNLFKYKEGDGYLDGLGGSIFALYEHYRLTKDENFLRSVYPEIKRACQLIKTLRAKQLKPELKNTPYYGLLSKSVSQDNFSIPAYLYIDDWWAIIGLKAGLESASILKKEKDIGWLRQEYKGLLESTLESIERVMKRDNISYIPAFADYWPEKMRTPKTLNNRILGDTQMAWAHRPALFPGQSLGIPIPLELFKNSYKKYWMRAGKFSNYDGGWFVEYEKIFWGYNVMLAHPLIYLDMRDIALKNINWNIEHQSCPGGWAEGVPSRLSKEGFREVVEGIIGDVPHGWVAAHYVLLLRDMLLREDGKKIILLSAIPQDWLKDGDMIEVKKAPTYFGKISFKLVSYLKKGYVKLLLEDKNPPPDGFILELPLKAKIKKVQIDGGVTHGRFDKQVIIPSHAKEVVVYYE
jgi:hypothetical protein